MKDVAANKRKESLKVAAALFVLGLVIVFFIVPLLTAKRSTSHAQQSTQIPARDLVVARNAIMEPEGVTAGSVDLLRRYGSWTGTEDVREVLSVPDARAKGDGR